MVVKTEFGFSRVRIYFCRCHFLKAVSVFGFHPRFSLNFAEYEGVTLKYLSVRLIKIFFSIPYISLVKSHFLSSVSFGFSLCKSELYFED